MELALGDTSQQRAAQSLLSLHDRIFGTHRVLIDTSALLQTHESVATATRPDRTSGNYQWTDAHKPGGVLWVSDVPAFDFPGGLGAGGEEATVVGSDFVIDGLVQ